MSGGPPGLFSGFGVELEYMIVKKGTLDVAPVADMLLKDAEGKTHNEYDAGTIWWSNELARHVIELKNNEPVSDITVLPELFQIQVNSIINRLNGTGARLLPGGAHPFMNPDTETVLWQYENNEIYESYDRIFSCRGHGWSNLQSTHLNLSFHGDDEFAKLHTAVRLVLPIIPALCAGSPFLNGRLTGLCDSRLEIYRNNQSVIPSIGGRVIPEPVTSEQEYMEVILEPMYRDIAPHDPHGILRHEWLNSRGAIARFERNAIEIRIIDSQECPYADVAVCALIAEVIKGLVQERWCDFKTQIQWNTEYLERIFLDSIRQGNSAIIDNRDFAGCFGFSCKNGESMAELWKHLVDKCIGRGNLFYPHLDIICVHGNLSERIIQSAGSTPSREDILETYRNLADCLSHGKTFAPHQTAHNL